MMRYVYFFTFVYALWRLARGVVWMIVHAAEGRVRVEPRRKFFFSHRFRYDYHLHAHPLPDQARPLDVCEGSVEAFHREHVN